MNFSLLYKENILIFCSTQPTTQIRWIFCQPNYHYRETISLGDEWYGRLSDNVRIRGAKSLACLAMSGEARSEDCEEANELRKEANKAELAVSSRFGQPCAIPRQAAGFANTNILILRPSAKKIKPDGSVSVVGKRRVTIVVRKSNWMWIWANFYTCVRKV